MRYQIIRKLKIFLLICISIFSIFICKPLNKKFSFLGPIPIFDPSKKVVFENHTGKFTNEFERTTSFQIYLSEKPFSNVKIGPISSSDTTEGIVLTESYIEFSPEDYNTPRTITVQGVNDNIADGNQEYRIKFGTIVTTDYSYSLFVIPDVIIVNTDKETAGIAASPQLGLATNEGGNSVEFNVVLSTQPGADVVIPGFVSSDTNECTVEGSLTFTSTNWDTPQKVRVTGVDDLYVDGAKNCLISSINSESIDKVYENKTIPIVTVVNVDDDIPGFTFIPITPAQTSEAGGQAQFSLVMNTRPYNNINISGITSNDPTEGSISPSNITFTTINWSTPQVLVVTGVDDFMQDGTINYTLLFPNSTVIDPILDYAYVNFPLPSAGSFSNLDNDTRGIVVEALAPTPSISPLSVTEGGTPQTFRVRLNSVPCDTPSTPENCTPTNTTLSFTNTNTTEYTISPSSLIFTPANYNSYQTITVSAVDDYVDDDNTNSTLLGDTILGTSDYAGLKPSDIPIEVIDNDTAGYIVTPIGGVTVDENDPGGTGLEAIIYVSLNSQPTSNVTISPIISTDTLEVIVAPTLGGGNTSINNRTIVFTPVKDEVIVNSDANSDGLNDTSTGGWNVPQAIRVRAVVDGTLDGNKVRAITFGTRTTTDLKYTNSVTTPLNSVPATNLDSGDPSIILQNISAFSFAENNTATITFQIRLATLPIGDVTISNIISMDTTEGVVLPNGGGAPITNRTLVFTPSTNTAPTGTNTTTGGWNMPQTVTIRSVADNFDDGNINFLIKIPSATGSVEYTGKFPVNSATQYNNTTGELTLTNNDNDTRGFTFSPNTTINISEGGADATFTLRLNSDPCSTPLTPETCTSGAVTINLLNNNPDQYTITPTSITFNAGSWNSAQEITISPFNDNYSESLINYTLSFGTIVSSTDYGGLTPNSRTISITDNDTASINLTPESGYGDVTSSVGGYTIYNLSLGSSPYPGNTVSVTVSVPSAAPQEGRILNSDNLTEVNSRVFTFDNSNWNTPQQFRVIGKTGVGTGSTNYTLSATSTEGPTLPPVGYTAGQYNSYQSRTASRTITNYHVGAGKKVRLAGNSLLLDEANTNKLYFYVLLRQAPNSDVNINFDIDTTVPNCVLPASVDSTKQFTIDNPSITITNSNWNLLLDTNRVAVSRVDDFVDDGDISCPIRITSITSLDSFYDNIPITDFELPTITVRDNDIRGYTFVSQSPTLNSRIAVSKSGTQALFNIRLSSRPMSNVTLTYSDTNNRINYPADITFTPSNWNTAQAVIISGKNNGPNSDENIDINIAATTAETSTGATNSGSYNSFSSALPALKVFLLYDLVRCTANDIGTCGTANLTGGVVPAVYSTSENGTQEFFAIKLRARPDSNVTIPISSSNTAEGIVSSASLVFTPANFSTYQIITITGVDDGVVDGSQIYNIIFGAMTGDAKFDQTIPQISITNQDND